VLLPARLPGFPPGVGSGGPPFVERSPPYLTEKVFPRQALVTTADKWIASL
jgi:hypothetical protein